MSLTFILIPQSYTGYIKSYAYVCIRVTGQPDPRYNSSANIYRLLLYPHGLTEIINQSIEQLTFTAERIIRENIRYVFISGKNSKNIQLCPL